MPEVDSEPVMQHLRETLRRDVFDQPRNRPLRPNELRRELVRGERLRRETHPGGQLANQQALSVEEQRARRVSTPDPPPTPNRAIRPHVAALKTPSGLRQAWLLKEILGPPLALRGPHTGDNDR